MSESKVLCPDCGSDAIDKNITSYAIQQALTKARLSPFLCTACQCPFAQDDPRLREFDGELSEISKRMVLVLAKQFAGPISGFLFRWNQFDAISFYRDAAETLRALSDSQRRIEDVTARMYDVIQRIQKGKKKEVTVAVRAKHIDFCRAMQRTCMACEGAAAALFDGDRFTGEIHHAVNVSDASLKATMAICSDCNKRINTDPLPVAVFQHYQIRLHRWLENAGPLFENRGSDA